MILFINKLAGFQRRPQRAKSARRSDDAEAEGEGKIKSQWTKRTPAQLIPQTFKKASP
jgi:hypothetical protein